MEQMQRETAMCECRILEYRGEPSRQIHYCNYNSISPDLIWVQLLDCGTFKKQPIGGGAMEEPHQHFTDVQRDTRQLKSLNLESFGKIKI